MGDDEKPDSSIPSWQRADPEKSHPPDGAPTPDQAEDSLVVARRFLDDEAVKSAPREKKVAFLTEKGVSEGDIKKLLPEDAATAQPEPEASQPESQSQPIMAPQPQSQLPSQPADRPPIVTYPEFLAKPTRPPPLVTTDRLLGALYSFAGLSAAIYGTSRLVLDPMVSSLTEARLDLSSTATHSLETLNTRLEGAVSVVPSRLRDTDSDANDPSEMFHRDVGTQTSAFEPAPEKADPSAKQADRIASLTKSLASLRDDLRGQSEDLDNVRTVIDVFRDDMDAMTYGSSHAEGYVFPNPLAKGEPVDEIRKARDNIRKVKGVLLSARSFPASTR